jgi:hypothetical protein
MKKFLLVVILALVFPLSAFADTSALETPSFDCGTSGACSLPYVQTATTSSVLVGHGVAWTLPHFDDVIDGFLYKFTIYSSSGGWSFFPDFSQDSGNTWLGVVVPCSLSSIYFTYPCQYNTINGTDTNQYIGFLPYNSYAPTRTSLADGTTWFKWRQNGGSPHDVTISAFQVAVVYHSASSPATTFSCPSTWLLSDQCTLLGGLFVPNSSLVTAQFSTLQASVSAKAPFAYINSALNIDLSNTSAATSTPNFSIPLYASYSGHVLFNTTMTLGGALPPLITNLLSLIRPAFNIMLWLMLIVYIFHLVETIL